MPRPEAGPTRPLPPEQRNVSSRRRVTGPYRPADPRLPPAASAEEEAASHFNNRGGFDGARRENAPPAAERGAPGRAAAFPPVPRPGAVVRRDTGSPLRYAEAFASLCGAAAGSCSEGGTRPSLPSGPFLPRPLPLRPSPPWRGCPGRLAGRGAAPGVRGSPDRLCLPFAGREARRGSPQLTRSGQRWESDPKRAFAELLPCRCFSRCFLPQPSPSSCLLVYL